MNGHAELLCHPGAGCASVRSLQAELEFRPDGGVHLCYTLTADLSRILIPEPRQPRTADGLWRHTCFEAFIAAEDGSRYHEFNFSPSGQWAAYAFDNYRVPRPWAARQPPDIRIQRTDVRLKLWADIAAADLPPNERRQPYRLGLTAVIETVDNPLSYWALRHSGPRPDFHRREGFTLSFAALG
ncbi:DOMON-like domain-containing protein [Methylosarcina fibrata]|uniref:DOMON-like domain-containing protein n=1 Tax=Methylosarcina fibrata TaxID=105972 RepID=UPI0012FB9F33|nr:DOMON-like domain-containing protein [Methylosarcina fibrata]